MDYFSKLLYPAFMPLIEERKNCLFLFKISSATHPTYTTCTWSKLKYISTKQRHEFKKKSKKIHSENWRLQFFHLRTLQNTSVLFLQKKSHHTTCSNTRAWSSQPAALVAWVQKAALKSSSPPSLMKKYSTKAFQLSSTCFSGSLLLTYAQLRNL